MVPHGHLRPGGHCSLTTDSILRALSHCFLSSNLHLSLMVSAALAVQSLGKSKIIPRLQNLFMNSTVWPGIWVQRRRNDWLLTEQAGNVQSFKRTKQNHVSKSGIKGTACWHTCTFRTSAQEQVRKAAVKRKEPWVAGGRVGGRPSLRMTVVFALKLHTDADCFANLSVDRIRHTWVSVLSGTIRGNKAECAVTWKSSTSVSQCKCKYVSNTPCWNFLFIQNLCLTRSLVFFPLVQIANLYIVVCFFCLGPWEDEKSQILK